MSRFLPAIVAALTIHTVSAEEPVTPPRDPAYELVWSDEFTRDGPPDEAKWRSEIGFARNQELQWYQAENSRCHGGFLVIEARQEKVGNPDYSEGSRDWRKGRKEAAYTSGSLITVGGNQWHFGRSEVRARFKALPGLWPAIWTTGLGRWPHAGEIDIMEFYQDKILANFVWAGKGGRDHWNTTSHPIEKFGKDTWDDRFHLWVTEWDEEKITIYLDGRLLNTLPMKTAINADGPAINPFLSPQRFRLNLAVGANGGDPSKTSFPQRYEIDYVRIYQRKTDR
ncbi:glycoside hydrolase family 16 protein [Luteolibacter yonseiensis]|uniref:Glycoside hydrolase family 16 protein n=1 Tax=Luteolibacter yonseiensis TaxID=1144680 RepID=A0A934R780_9BACT|nr:glycoside hydrolase family 16 protein [Luteolibacter yonseiensis]MBK1816720.1 glycoside hydrolase family 16 protein [Luteolibacter yonseiensis]